MRKVILTIASIAVFAGGAIALRANEQAETKLISGEVVSLCNYLINDQKGVEGAEAGQFLVGKRGLPVAILEDGTDNLYLTILKGNKSASEKLTPLMGKKVNAQGVVYEKHGVKLLEISVVAEAM